MTQQNKSSDREIGHIALLTVLLPLIVPLAVIGIMLFLAYRLTLNALVRFWWLPKGKDILLIHSDSPIWHEYMTNQILPLVRSRAEILNWSEHSRWPNWSLAVRLF